MIDSDTGKANLLSTAAVRINKVPIRNGVNFFIQPPPAKPSACVSGAGFKRGPNGFAYHSPDAELYAALFVLLPEQSFKSKK